MSASMSSMQIPKNAQCSVCGNTYMADAKFCRRCGTERNTDNSLKVGEKSISRQNSKSSRRSSKPDIWNLVQDQIARHRSTVLYSLDELASQIAARVQALQDNLEGELSRVRKENEWFKNVPAGRGSQLKGSQPKNGPGSSRLSVDLSATRDSVTSFDWTPMESVLVLDVDPSDDLSKKESADNRSKSDAVTAFDPLTNSDTAGDFPRRENVEKPQTLNNSLLVVVPEPEGEAPQTILEELTLDADASTMGMMSSLLPLDGSMEDSMELERDSDFKEEMNNFQVLEAWKNRRVFRSAKGTAPFKQATTAEVQQFAEMETHDEYFLGGNILELNNFKSSNSLAQHKNSCTPIVIHPNSFVRGSWDLASLILVFYDLIFIPLLLLDLPYSTFAAVAAWITRIFWTLDLIMSPITGYIVSDGSIEMRPRPILMRYLKGWFAIDLFIVLVDWLEMFWAAGSGLGFARIGKASRIFRILRLVRLLRLIRMLDIMRDFMERMHSERLVILASILKIMVVICGMAHLMACIWYRVGNSEVGRTWLREHLYNSDSLEYKYMTSLHWSISQFSGGMDEVRPQNFGERVYAILCFLIAFIMAGVFISSITSSMTQLHFLSSRKSQQVNVLRRFLTQHGISHRLAVRVQRNATHAMDQQQRYMPESNVELLELVSTPLRSRVHFEMFAPTFAVHPFFARYVQTCPHVMRRVCHSATSMQMTSCCDVIFNAGEIAAKPAMYIVCTGILNYVSLSGSKYKLIEDAVLAEAVLWTTWMHQGTLTAETNSHLLVLDAHNFQFIVTQFEHIDLDPKEYAEKFVQDLNEAGELSDLPRHLQEDALIEADIFGNLQTPKKNSKRKADRIFGMRHSRSVAKLNSDMNV